MMDHQTHIRTNAPRKTVVYQKAEKNVRVRNVSRIFALVGNMTFPVSRADKQKDYEHNIRNKAADGMWARVADTE